MKEAHLLSKYITPLKILFIYYFLSFIYSIYYVKYLNNPSAGLGIGIFFTYCLIDFGLILIEKRIISKKRYLAVFIIELVLILFIYIKAPKLLMINIY